MEIEEKSVESAIGEIDYAILKSISYDINTITDIVKILQIRTITLERHIYRLINEVFINLGLDSKFNLTVKGIETISNFEKENPDKWSPINDFILSATIHQKEQRTKIYKIIDNLLLLSMIFLILLIIYFGKSLMGL